MLSDQEKSILRQFKASLEQTLSGQLIEMRLFGSKARGDDHTDSDIDVLIIVASDDWHIRDKVYDVATDMLLQADVCKQRRLSAKADSTSFAKKALLSYTMSARIQLKYDHFRCDIDTEIEQNIHMHVMDSPKAPFHMSPTMIS